MIEEAVTMVSPITGGKMTLHWEWREVEFRKALFKVMFPFYRCEDTGEQFTTTESDGVWARQLHAQYCFKYGIPFVDEIVALRRRYGVSASKMSLILGLGENQYRRYEQEEVPNLSNGKIIRSAMNPKVFLDLVEGSKGLLGERDYTKIISRLHDIIDHKEEWRIRRYDTMRVFASGRSEENGYAPLSLERLRNVLLYVLNHCGEVWCTKMNKMLFYIDFLAYRNCGMAVSGLSYRAIDFGPVPERWERVYSEFEEVRQESRETGDFEGIVLVANGHCDESLFSADELRVMLMVCERFKDTSSREISRISHEESAWKEYYLQRQKIPFSEAIGLRAW